MKSGRPALMAASVAHALAWVPWLFFAFWPHTYQGVSATPVQVDELGNLVGTGESQVVRHSASFVEVNGIGSLLAIFIPVVLTGLALVVLLTWQGRGAGRVLVMGGLALAILAFCVLGYLSVGMAYVPAALAMIAATLLSNFRAAAREG